MYTEVRQPFYVAGVLGSTDASFPGNDNYAIWETDGNLL